MSNRDTTSRRMRSVRLDASIHGLGSEIDTARPSHSAQIHEHFAEAKRIDKHREDSGGRGVDERRHVDQPLGAIDKPNVQAKSRQSLDR